ncbi:MAG: hypothetical protein O2954_08995 [bacterium]|nr:hypothetical protein [bacterium]
MKFVLHRFDGSLLSVLSDLKDRRKQFQRLVAARPTGVVVQTRTKNPAMDIKRQYRTVLSMCLLFSATFHTIVALLFPTLELREATVKKDQMVIQMEDIPETRQVHRPPPPPVRRCRLKRKVKTFRKMLPLKQRIWTWIRRR